MNMLVEQDEDRARLVLSGAIDECGAADLKERFRELDPNRVKLVILDFAKVTQIGSAGIGKLLLFYKTLAGHGGEIRLVKLPAHIRELFEELHLNTLFTLS